MTQVKLSNNPLRGLTIGVIGLGQIGGSLAAALTSSGIPENLVGCDVDRDLEQTALARGIIHRRAENLSQLIDESRMVIFATHHRITLRLIEEHASRLREKLLVTDTGSLKHEVMALAESLRLDNFVGGHPIAGSEKSGADSWNARLFNHAVYVFASGADAKESSIDLMQAMIRTIGGRPVGVDPVEHDRIFSLTIGLPHVLAFILSNMARGEREGETVAALATGPSWRGATRVAASDERFVEQMLWNNRQQLSSRIDDLIAQLERFRDGLIAREPSVLRRLLTEGYIVRGDAEGGEQ
jgi:prephenate dehydrogenase